MSAFTTASAVPAACTTKPRFTGSLPNLRRCRIAPVRPSRFVVRAEDDDDGPAPQRKFITREQEPEEYWTSKAERDGESPMKDPMAWVGLLGIFFPFIILGIAIGTGYVELNP
ncbi:hypothetical protein BSKO_09531 [Bryopsis sp. KO-2023]|nr:hypothetical protein BSKO_09531 [Bryopsis sp. KO-2023]